jgi:ATPase family associated with various cellular activities (AAA)
MNLHIRVRYLKDVNTEVIRRAVSYRDADQFIDIDAGKFTDEQLETVYARASKDDDDGTGKTLCRKIASYRKLRADPSGNKVGRLEPFAVALRAYVEPSPNKWLFHEESDEFAVPYFVSHIAYCKADPRSGSQANVSVRLEAVTRGYSDGESLKFHVSDLGKTVPEILAAKGYHLETDGAVATYMEDIELYKKLTPLTGEQFSAIGTGYPESYSSYDDIAMEREGQAATVVMDDGEEEEERSNSRDRTEGTTANASFWRKGGKSDDDDDDDDEGSDVAKPVHPYVKVFDLDRHEFMLIHVRNLTPYEYDKTAASKLVLDEQTKSLITILVEGSSEVMEDIIKGKTGGTIVIATGPPGTGKTLTAEVFAEEIQKPLYVVQCSQLGTEESTVEKELLKVLTRASRWRAILLIDEADVYVHARGSDIQQNAIVGVFLRVLEHYRGVLFLTSNRATVIDDAIMSRATAWIRYTLPTREQLTEIWNVLSKQYEMPMSGATIRDLVNVFPGISGRNVKNLLKLGRMLYKRDSKKNKIDVELFQYVSNFLDLKTNDGEEES